MRATFRTLFRSPLASGLLGAGLLSAAAIAADRLFPPDLTRYRTVSLQVLAADGTPLREYVTPDGKLRFAASPEAVDPRYVKLLLSIEDRRFWWHPGIDPLALMRALLQIATRGHVVSGGSTLTMQVARLLSPHRHDVAGKLEDMLRAAQLEWRFGKRKILAMYLTLAPMGGNIEGVSAAAQRYFGHGPDRLSPAEAALLVAIPQSPTRLRPDRQWPAARIAMARIEARASPPVPSPPLGAIRRLPGPMLAAHLGDWVAKSRREGVVTTTLDAALQRSAEALAAREAGWLGDHATIAALALRNEDRAVLLYLGGSDYRAARGQVDMVRALRSPGSTLKPFIYGLAFDDGIAAPETLISDDPYRSGNYAPADFDRQFRGSVTVEAALQQSLNSPAVQVLDRIGPGRFAASLQLAGVHLGFPHGRWNPSLPIALGGIGISLNDLAMLYSGLAEGGQVVTLRLIQDAAAGRSRSLMSRYAAAEILAICRDAPLPDGVAPPRRAIAYKTGTSYGFRDALAIGVSPSYTVAVWVGRPEGTPRPGAYGRNTAAPFLFKLFDLLPGEEDNRGWTLPEDKLRSAGMSPLLARFVRRQSVDTIPVAAGDPPRILYPPSGAQIELAQRAGSRTPLTLEAVGGVRPYRWIVNGQPLPAPKLGGRTGLAARRSRLRPDFRRGRQSPLGIGHDPDRIGAKAASAPQCLDPQRQP